MTTEYTSSPSEMYAAAAVLARKLTTDDNPVDPAFRFGRAFAELFEVLDAESQRLGALPPRVRQLGLDVATLFLAIHAADEREADLMERAADVGDPFVLALEVMRLNQSVSPAGSAPRVLATAFVDLVEYVADPSTSTDRALRELLRRVCTAVVAVEDASPDELGLDGPDPNAKIVTRKNENGYAVTRKADGPLNVNVTNVESAPDRGTSNG